MTCARTCSSSAAASLALADAVRVRLGGSRASASAPCASCQIPKLSITFSILNHMACLPQRCAPPASFQSSWLQHVTRS